MMANIMKYLTNNMHRPQRVCRISMGDIFLARGRSINETQFLATSRFLDVKKYVEENNTSFKYRNTLCKAIHGEKHNIIKSNQNFKTLISSIKTNGFNPSFPVILNKYGDLIEGNHRCGISLYFKIEYITARINMNGRDVPHNIDNFINKNIPVSIISKVYEEFKHIQSWLIENGHTYVIILNEIFCEDQIKHLISKVNYIVTILKITKLRKGVVLIQFSVDNPNYEYANGVIISKRCFEIEKILKRNFPDINLLVSKSCLEGRKLVDLYCNI